MQMSMLLKPNCKSTRRNFRFQFVHSIKNHTITFLLYTKKLTIKVSKYLEPKSKTQDRIVYKFLDNCFVRSVVLVLFSIWNLWSDMGRVTVAARTKSKIKSWSGITPSLRSCYILIETGRALVHRWKQVSCRVDKRLFELKLLMGSLA